GGGGALEAAADELQTLAARDLLGLLHALDAAEVAQIRPQRIIVIGADAVALHWGQDRQRQAGIDLQRKLAEALDQRVDPRIESLLDGQEPVELAKWQFATLSAESDQLGHGQHIAFAQHGTRLPLPGPKLEG